MIKAIVLDWHGVLDNRTLSGMLKTLLKSSNNSSVSRKVLRKKILQVFRHSLWRKYWKQSSEYAAGRMHPKEFWKLVEGDFPLELVVRAQNYFLSVERNELLWKQLPLLKQNYKLAILSDCPEDKTELIKKTQDLSLFDEAIFSSDYHLLKKNASFYQLVARRLHLKAGECLVVDDSRKNLLLARRRGFKTKFYNPNKKFNLAKLTEKN